jgi:hypothetical protein
MSYDSLEKILSDYNVLHYGSSFRALWRRGSTKTGERYQNYCVGDDCSSVGYREGTFGARLGLTK